MALGDEALRDIASGGENNTAIGRASGANIDTGDHNSALGQNSLASTTTGSNNTALGSGSLCPTPPHLTTQQLGISHYIVTLLVQVTPLLVLVLWVQPQQVVAMSL